MKIKKKEKEQTAMEKRNTSIVTFILTALLPLLLCSLLGFTLGNSKSANEDNFHEQLSALRQENSRLNMHIDSLGSIFSKSDVLLSELNENLEELEDQLNQAETERHFNRWENDKDDTIDDFEHRLKKIARAFDDNEQIDGILEMGKKWLREYAQSKSNELFQVKLTKKQEIGIEVNTDLTQQIQDLNNQIGEKNTAITGLQQQLQLATMVSANAKSSGQETKVQLQNVGAIRDKIDSDVMKIRTDLLEQLQPKKFLKKNDNEINTFKASLKDYLDAIQRHAAELK